MCVFLANHFRKISFLIFSIKRRPFRPEKESLKKVQNIEFFLFLSKIELFIIYVFLGKSSQTRSFPDILYKKVCFFDQKKKLLKMTKKLKFSKGCPRFLSKNRTSYHLCFLGKSSHKKIVFGNSG